MAPVDKKRLVDALRHRLLAALEALTASQKAAQAAAVHPDAKQEHAKDMRATEASYVARGLAERVETLRDGIRALERMPIRSGKADTVATGALVTVADDDGNESVYLLAPAGGGEMLDADGRSVLVLTPQSPLGLGLLGQGLGDSVTAELPRGRISMEVVRID